MSERERLHYDHDWVSATINERNTLREALERIVALDHGDGADAAHMLQLAREALEAKP